jgi:hypothetical protein
MEETKGAPNSAQSSLAVRMNEQKDLKQEIVKTSNPEKKKVVYRARSGMFAKSPKAPTALETQRATAAKLTAVSPEKPKSDFEEILESQILLAKRTDAENIGTAGTKAAEFLTKAAGFSLTKPETQGQSITVIIPFPDLMNNEVHRFEDQKKKPTKPSFATDAPYIDAAVVSTNGR